MTEYTVPEGYRLQPEEEYYDTQVVLDDLRTLVLRLAHALARPGGNVLLAQRAMAYLKRKGLMPSPLREDDDVPARDSGARDDFAWRVVKAACETEPADEDDPECIRILRLDLKSAVLAAFLSRDAMEDERHV